MIIRNFHFYIFFLFVSFCSSAYSLPTYINPNNWVEKAPSKSLMNVYDEKLLNTVPRFWHNISPSGYNLGTKIEVEVLIWEGKNFCAFLSYDRIFDPDWAVGSSYFFGKKLKNLFRQSNNTSSYPFYNEKCALFDTSADYSGKKKWQYNENIGRIDKKKGIKGNLKPVRVQTFEYLDPTMECLFFAGGLGNSSWIGYSADLTLAAISGHICVEDKSYFTSKKIKQIARSLGVEDIQSASLKIKAPPPDDLKLDLSKFETITGKRDDYSIFAINTISKISDSQNIENENINNLSLEDKLKSLKNLFDQKLISKEDYDKKRKEILDSF